MSKLLIEPHFGPDDSAVVQVFDRELGMQQQPLTVEGSASFDLDEGSYLIRLQWSDGQRSQQVVDMTRADLRVPIEAPGESHASLVELGDPIQVGRATLDVFQPGLVAPDGVGPRVPSTAAPSGVGGGEGTLSREEDDFLLHPPDLAIHPGGLGRGDRLGAGTTEPTYALWRKQSGSWERIELVEPPIPIDNGIQFELTVDEGLNLFEIQSRDEHQFLSLPAEHSVVAVRWFWSGDELYPRADARTADRDVEALRGYIQRGELDVARAVAPEVMAERYLRSKVSAPRIAALGAYFLLRICDLERLHDWPDNLTRWKTWLPDGPVIAAWKRLRSEEPDYEEVHALLMEAVRRGLPIYTEGVRLLKDGLDLFASDDERDWDVDAAREQIDRYARAMVWGKSETTFFGDAPDRPRTARSEGFAGLGGA